VIEVKARAIDSVTPPAPSRTGRDLREASRDDQSADLRSGVLKDRGAQGRPAGFIPLGLVRPPGVGGDPLFYKPGHSAVYEYVTQGIKARVADPAADDVSR
jgi:hypothetical protein